MSLATKRHTQTRVWDKVAKLNWRPFDEARAFVQELGLTGKEGKGGWREYCKSGKKPGDIPYNARTNYSDDWAGWGDWLGTGEK